MKYRTTFLSALIFPGLGQMLSRKGAAVRWRGAFLILSTLAALTYLIRQTMVAVDAAIKKLPALPSDPNDIMQLALEIQKKVQGDIISQFEFGTFCLTVLWI